MNTPADFFEFMKTHHSEIVSGYEKRFKCPVCLEEKSNYKAVFCSNGHNSCCFQCAERILSTKDERSSPCTICRKPDVIVSNKSKEEMIRELENHLSFERYRSEEFKKISIEYKRRSDKYKHLFFECKQEYLRHLQRTEIILSLNVGLLNHKNITMRDLNNYGSEKIHVFDASVNGENIHASKKNIYFFKNEDGDIFSQDYNMEFSKQVKNIKVGMKLTLIRKVDGLKRKYEFRDISF